MNFWKQLLDFAKLDLFFSETDDEMKNHAKQQNSFGDANPCSKKYVLHYTYLRLKELLQQHEIVQAERIYGKNIIRV